MNPRKIQIALVTGALVLVALGVFRGDLSVQKYFKLVEMRSVLQGTVARLKVENQKILMEINNLKNSPEYAKQVLRDRYHITDSNERIIFFAD